MNWQRVLKIIKKEFIQLRRDPKLLLPILLTPILQLMVFGYAVTTDVRHIDMAVLDEDRTSASRQFIERFAGSGYFDYNHYIVDPRQIDRLLDQGEAQMVLRIRRGFARDLQRNRPAPVQIILDASNSSTAGIIAGYAAGVVQAYSGDVAMARLDRIRASVPRVPGVEERLQVWYNPELKSINYMVPGVMCTILLTVTTILTSMAIVKEREIGTLEQLIVTPLTPRELMVGKTAPFVVVGFVDMILVLLVSTFWFRVPIAGSLLLLFALTTIFLLTSLGVGLFISTISHTQQQATMTSFFFFLPSIILSGFIFPIENMPWVVQLVTYLIPMRYFLTIVRGIFLKGVGIEILWPQVAALVIMGVVIIWLSAARFSKRLG